jgi:hypothetical protein
VLLVLNSVVGVGVGVGMLNYKALTLVIAMAMMLTCFDAEEERCCYCEG